MDNIFNPAPGTSFDENFKVIATEAVPAAEVSTEDMPPTPDAADAVPAKQVGEATAPVSDKPEIDWGAVLAERTGGKYKSWDEVNMRLTEDPTPLTFANEDSKKVFDYLREGKIDDVLQVYNEQKRLSSLKDMTDDQVVKLAMEYRLAGLSAEDVEDEFLTKYTLEKPEPPNPDDFLDEEAQAKAEKAYERDLKRYEKEHKALQRLLKQDATEARSYLTGLKKDILLPDISPAVDTTLNNSVDEERAQAELLKYREEYVNSLNKSAGEFKEIPIKITDEGVSFDGRFEIDEAERQQLKKDLEEKNVFQDLLLSRYVKGDSYDTKQLMEDIYWLNNKEKIVSSLVKQALSQGKLEKIKETKNVDLEGNHRENFTPSAEVQLKEFSSNFLRAR